MDNGAIFEVITDPTDEFRQGTLAGKQPFVPELLFQQFVRFFQGRPRRPAQRWQR